MSKTELPFLIVHGAWIGVAVIVCLPVLWMLIARQARRWWTSVVARRRTRDLEDGLGSPDVGDVVIAGLVRGGCAQSLLVGGGYWAHERTPGLWLDCDGERIELAGDAVVIRGSSCEQCYLDVPAATTPALRDRVQACSGPMHLLAVRDGDRVIATGSIRKAEGTESLELDSVQLSARLDNLDIRPAPRSLARIAWTFILLLGLTGWISMEVGRVMVEQARSTTWTFNGSPSELDPVAIGAALPSSRTDVLDAYEYQLRNLARQTVDSVRVRLAIAELRRGCSGTAHVLFNAERFAESSERAIECGVDDVAFESLVREGRYEDAALHVPSDIPYLEAVMQIGLANWSAAAAAATRLGTKMHDDAMTGATPEHRAAFRRRELDFACLSELFRTWSGTPSPRLGELATRRESAICALALGELTERTERAIVIQRFWPQEAFHENGLRAALDREQGLRSDLDELRSTSDLFGERADGRVWLAPMILSAHANDLRVHAWQASARMQQGDFAAAAASALLCRQAAHAHESCMLELAEAVALRGGTADRSDLDAIFLHIDRPLDTIGRDLSSAVAHPEGCTAGARMALVLAHHGDGRPLESILRNCHVLSTSDIALLAVAPHIVLGRAALAETVRFKGYRPTGDALPFRWVHADSLRRDLLRSLGDTEEAARWQRIIARHTRVFADRRRLIGLLLLGA